MPNRPVPGAPQAADSSSSDIAPCAVRSADREDRPRTDAEVRAEAHWRRERTPAEILHEYTLWGTQPPPEVVAAAARDQRAEVPSGSRAADAGTEAEDAGVTPASADILEEARRQQQEAAERAQAAVDQEENPWAGLGHGPLVGVGELISAREAMRREEELAGMTEEEVARRLGAVGPLPPAHMPPPLHIAASNPQEEEAERLTPPRQMPVGGAEAARLTLLPQGESETARLATAQLDERLAAEESLRVQMASAAEAGATSSLTVELARAEGAGFAEVVPAEDTVIGPAWDAEEDRRVREERDGGEAAPVLGGSRAADSRAGATPSGTRAPLAGFVAASKEPTAAGPSSLGFRPLCADFARGTCRRGNDCPFAHSMAAAAFLGMETVQPERELPERRDTFSPVSSSIPEQEAPAVPAQPEDAQDDVFEAAD